LQAQKVQVSISNNLNTQNLVQHHAGAALQGSWTVITWLKIKQGILDGQKVVLEQQSMKPEVFPARLNFSMFPSYSGS
jgi:hypothetical protein